MRGNDQQLQTGMFSYVALEDRIPADHPLRGVRALVDAVLGEMSKDFDGLYSQVGRPSIAPERLLRALLARHGRPVCRLLRQYEAICEAQEAGAGPKGRV